MGGKVRVIVEPENVQKPKCRIAESHARLVRRANTRRDIALDIVRAVKKRRNADRQHCVGGDTNIESKAWELAGELMALDGQR